MDSARRPRFLVKGALSRNLWTQNCVNSRLFVTMAPIHKNAVLFIGLNPDAFAEARELERHCQVIFIGNSKKADQIMVDGHSYDLATPEGRKAALAKVTLSKFQRDTVDAVLGDAYRNSRDELGKLAVAWARYERANSFPNRMVISAHHAGSLEFWGKTTGRFPSSN